MKRKYENHNFKQKSLKKIEQVNAIIDEYTGRQLTLRQMFYQLVARGIVKNSKNEYDNLGNLIANARYAGLIDWEKIEDKTRDYQGSYGLSWTPAEQIENAVKYFRLNKWQNQPIYVEVWCEKDAMIDIVKRGCRTTGTPCFSTRGYCSASELWRAANHFIRRSDCKERHIIYLGDHDPSGVDMPRYIAEKMKLFGADVEIHRIALTMEQIQQFNPPPSFVKTTDARKTGYIEKYGDTCWELDALKPGFVEQLVDSAIRPYIDQRILAETLAQEEEQRKELQLISDNYLKIAELVMQNYYNADKKNNAVDTGRKD